MITRYVNTASSAGGDGTTNATAGATRAYATLREALDAIGGSLSDAMTIYCDGAGGPDMSDCDQPAWDFTTTAANYLRVTTQGAARHTGKWTPSAYRLEATNRNGLYNNLPCHLRVDGLQVHVTVTNASSYVCIKTTNANQSVADIDCRISHCIVVGVRVSGNIVGCNTRPHGGGGAGGTARVWNCLAIGCYNGFNNDYNVGEYYNCTAARCEYGFVEDGTMLAVNCLSTAASIGFVGTFAAGSDYNVVDDGNGAPGAHSRILQTFTFIDPGRDDYHLASYDAGARGFGLTDPASGVFADDIDGQTRSGAWDIGADQYAYVAPGPPVASYRRFPKYAVRR